MLQIGKVLKSNGTEGGVLIGFRDIDPEDILTEEPVYIYFDGLPVPFFFTSFAPKGGDKALARLSSVDSLRDAEEIVGREVYADYFEEIEEGQGPEALTGWQVNGEGVVAGWLDIPEDAYAVVVTSGHLHDFEVLEQLLRRDLAYVGVIGSRKKTAAVNEKLRAAGIDEERLARVHAPIGLAIGAVTPQEIAVSIAAEMIAVRAERRKLGRSVSQ